ADSIKIALDYLSMITNKTDHAEYRKKLEDSASPMDLRKALIVPKPLESQILLLGEDGDAILKPESHPNLERPINDAIPELLVEIRRRNYTRIKEIQSKLDTKSQEISAEELLYMLNVINWVLPTFPAGANILNLDATKNKL